MVNWFIGTFATDINISGAVKPLRIVRKRACESESESESENECFGRFAALYTAFDFYLPANCLKILFIDGLMDLLSKSCARFSHFYLMKIFASS